MDNRRLGRDLMSDLPVGIIEIILVRLPIRDAIRTSILSTKWRFRWVTIPHLAFDSRHDTRCQHDSRRWRNFVTCTLFRHQGPLHKFTLHAFSMQRTCPDMDPWLFFLYRKDIKELILDHSAVYGDNFDLSSSCLYSLQNLTYLELGGCELSPPPPTFKGFLFLRTLFLRFVDAPFHAIEIIVANSPLLENLECTYIGPEDEELTIRLSAPNLKYFLVKCDARGIYLCHIYLCAPLLAKLSVKIDEGENDYSGELPQPNNSVCNYTEFLGGFTNLESLTGDGLFTKYLSIGIEYYHPPLVFHHLHVIALCQVNFKDRDEILVVIRLIMDAANLRELHLGSHICYFDDVDASNAPHIHVWDSECPQNCTFEKLKVIKMTEFHGSLHEMKFVEFLLGSSPLLKKMIVEPFGFRTKDEILDATLKLLSYRRTSASAQVLFKKR